VTHVTTRCLSATSTAITLLKKATNIEPIASIVPAPHRIRRRTFTSLITDRRQLQVVLPLRVLL
jgi:hypothetical protein